MRPLAKLDHQYLGPVKILEQVNPVAFRLQLPESLWIHTEFHVSFLKPYIKNPFLPWSTSPPPPITVQGQEKYLV